MSNTGIICTIGPASQTKTVLSRMIKAGMGVVRLNFSHGTHAEHLKRIKVIKRLNQDSSHPTKLLQDLEGFRIRIGTFEHLGVSTIKLLAGQIVVLANQPVPTKYQTLPLDYDGPLTAVAPGSTIFIDDGNIALEAIKICEKSIRCRVINPGLLKEHKGINIPSAQFPFTGFGEKDRRDLEFGIANKVDFVAQSFVRTGQDIIDIRTFMNERNFNCPIIAKIENLDGIKNIDDILDVADGIMVARGDLGVSLPIYKVPILQKRMINKCRQRLKTAITATHMLESMITNPRPTRAEVSDVANAILDGTNYVMLSGETAIGKYPVETIEIMQKIIDFAEKSKAI
ncbi:MAG: pyruvate kinase [candidate division Zixibacteria bacterium]|nr:pyruvate kinase [candidate division Zixibacteria bacterium]